MTNRYRRYGYNYYSLNNYGKPKYITRKGYFILFNGGGYNCFSWVSIPNYITKLLSRLRQSALKIKEASTKVRYKVIITIFRIEDKLNRVAYINQLTINLL